MKFLFNETRTRREQRQDEWRKVWVWRKVNNILCLCFCYLLWQMFPESSRDCEFLYGLIHCSLAFVLQKTVNEQSEVDFTFSKPLKWAWPLRLQESSPFVRSTSVRIVRLVFLVRETETRRRKFMRGRCLSRGNKKFCKAFTNLCCAIKTSSQTRLKATSVLHSDKNQRRKNSLANLILTE